MVKVSVSTRLSGDKAAWAFDIFSGHDGMHLDAGVLQRLLSLIQVSTDSGFRVNRVETVLGFALELASDGRPDSADLATALTGPASGEGSDGDRIVGLLFDWPWQLAFGFAPISADSASLADIEPRGWLEVILALRAASSPFYLEIDADYHEGDLTGLLASLGPVRSAGGLTGDSSAAAASDFGQIFLIADGNGEAGYQPGEDFLIAIGGAPLADLAGQPDIFV